MFREADRATLKWIGHKIDRLLKLEEIIMALDLTKLNAGETAAAAAIAALRQENADLKAKLAAVPTTDPADQAAVDAVGDKLASDAATPAA